MMTPTAFTTLGLGALFTGIVAGWEQVKNLLARIIGILITTVEVRERCYDAVNAFCWMKLQRSPTPFHYYTGRTKFIRPLARYGPVAYESLGDAGQLFWYGKKPLWVGLSSRYTDRATFRFLRWTFDPDKLIAEVMSTHMETIADPNAEEAPDRFRVYRMAGASGKDLMGMQQWKSSKGAGNEPVSEATPRDSISSTASEGRLVGWDKDDIGEIIPQANPIERLSLTPEVQEAIAEVRRWFTSKDWYAERQIPWRRGLLFHGKPGTGKSSLTKALAQSLKIPIYLFDISTMDNQEFHKAWQTALSNTPAIALIEDIDAVFHGRENVVAEKGQGLTYDCLLNTISGVESADGLLLVVTTNCLDKVDPALGIPEGGSASSRPGRIDRAIELPSLDFQGRMKLARRIMAGCHPSWVPYLAQIGVNDTGAQFEDRCAQTALGLFWSANPQEPAPEVAMAVEVIHEHAWTVTDKSLTFAVEES